MHFQVPIEDFGTRNYIHTDIFMMLSKGKEYSDFILEHEYSKIFWQIT
jgi:hypothetical protein